MLLWEDDEFLAADSSISFKGESRGTNTKWLRPSELCEWPTLRGTDTSPPIQGLLGDCWLICTFKALTKSSDAWEKVFGCEDMALFGSGYNGKISIQLFVDCDWTEVVVDDRLPVISTGKSDALLYATCSEQSQFWASILEKACAKVYGCYEALHAGQISEGFLLITGGYTWIEQHSTELAPNFIKLLSEKIKSMCNNNEKGMSHMFVSCVASILSTADGQPQRELESSFISTNEANEMHCYMVESIRDTDPGRLTLSIWNPWKPVDTNRSSFSDISLHDILKHAPTFTFSAVNLGCVFGNDLAICAWTERHIALQWQACSNSGGNTKLHTYEQNPQCLLSLAKNFTSGIVHITLTQKSKRRCNLWKKLEQAVGVHIWALPIAPQGRLSLQQINSLKSVVCTSPPYKYAQSVSVLFAAFANTDSVHIKHFLVIPSTFTPNINADFSLRLCSSYDLKELKEL